MRILAPLILAAAAVAAEPVRLPEAIDLENAKDPVDGAKVALGQEVRWHGVLVHFANPDNAAAFAKKPEKYLKKLKVKLVATETGKDIVDLGNAKCPVSGKPAKDGLHLDRAGIRIRLSDAEHAKAVAKDPKKYYAALGYGYAPSVIDLQNTECPVTGDACYLEAPIWHDVDGIRVRVCCDSCIEEMKESPKRCFQALMVDPAALKKKFAPK